ncbi:DNA cytosine methyltransferase [Bacillus cereus]|uniref:DNA cytosine methyltransferase n=1 Tax=Bacillus cereus group TaxID=86661 RepID=UPI0005DD1430|nr:MULTISPECIES: DNA cytosine methyltransferase [Bacillus cereus group]MBJ6721511.1 DNA cytosine methyltransferase [Bacillus sp. PR5]CKH28597.1 cytosine-specific methyltransferase [Streptococcus pneumoniae]ARV96324.1 DNA (cytosine-5-)-methyltransferase [Bacillus thuringiensis]MDZ4570830.1 DNA cytosine methyltransferase [Bacillus cereus]MDZ4638023.1 DNA cytosine methyltransferase [Bacillus cereus]
MTVKYKLGSMFAGIGGTCLGFQQAGAEIVWANEVDRNASITYRHFWKGEYLQEADVTEVDKTTVPQLDILIGGFPCQAFSIAGYRKGFEDERGNMFFQILDVIDAQEKMYGTKPKAIMLENVKNLKGHDKGNTFKVIKECLEQKGYTIKAKVLNSMEYGNVPQNRERIYIVGFLENELTAKFDFPAPIPLTNTLNTVINRNSSINDEKYKAFYYLPEKVSFYNELQEGMTSHDTVYQWRRVYVRENKNNVCPTLTANMGTGGHNVPLILDNENNIRKLTPKECLLLQGFPEELTLPEGMANSHLYKQAGNSVTVPVIRRIASNIIEVLRGNELTADVIVQEENDGQLTFV